MTIMGVSEASTSHARVKKMTIQFQYNGTTRIANIIEAGETFFKCENISADGGKPSRPFSTYAKSKMEYMKSSPQVVLTSK